MGCIGYQENMAHRMNWAEFIGAHITETEVAIAEPTWFCARPSAHMLRLFCLFFFFWVGFLSVGAEVFLTLLSALGTFFFLLGYLIKLWYEGLCLLLLFLCHVLLLPLEGLLFYERKRKSSRSGWRESGGDWKEKKKGRTWSGYIVWEKNKEKWKRLILRTCKNQYISKEQHNGKNGLNVSHCYKYFLINKHTRNA